MAKRPKSDELSPVARAIQSCRKEAEDARRGRLHKARRNMAIYLGEQDWSHKQDGQSKEFLPKTSVAVEQFSAFVKRALVQFGDWYSVETKGPLTPEQVRALLDCFFNRLSVGNEKKTALPLVVSDAIKAGLLEGLLIFKVHGRKVHERRFFVEPGDPILGEPDGLTPDFIEPWRLAVDVVRIEDYYPDPTGRGLYEVHRVERDLHEIVTLAEQGVYDEEIVEKIVQDFDRPDDEKRSERLRNQNDAQPPDFRKRVVLDEFWGTLLDEKGRVKDRNIVATLANDRYEIRKPTPNPFWHGESPFVTSPLIRVPHSVWHKALFDDAAGLNVALNELFNLMLDGGMASVWGIKQLRGNWLEDPGQVSGGIPQGATLLLSDEAPAQGKVLEQLTEGDVPQDALAMYNLLDREFQSAALTSDIKLGLLPAKQVKATEVIEASQSQAVTLDSIASDVEKQALEPLIRKAWLTILQNTDDLASEDIVAAIGMRGALTLARMSPAQRFATWAGQCEFRVNGLSSTLSKVRDFQKLSALLQIVIANPILMQAFFTRYSGEKILQHAMRLLNFNPTNMERDPEEQGKLGEQFNQLSAFAQLGGKPASVSGAGTGGSELPAEINQNANPLTGLAG